MRKRNLRLILTRIFSQDIRMKFGREKCAILIMRKIQMKEETERLNQEKLERLDKRKISST